MSSRLVHRSGSALHPQSGDQRDKRGEHAAGARSPSRVASAVASEMMQVARKVTVAMRSGSIQRRVSTVARIAPVATNGLAISQTNGSKTNRRPDSWAESEAEPRVVQRDEEHERDDQRARERAQLDDGLWSRPSAALDQAEDFRPGMIGLLRA